MIRAKIDMATIWALKGWAYNTEDPQTPLNLEIYVNDELIDRTIADKKRVLLAEQGLHPTGHAGFSYYLGDRAIIKSGDYIHIRYGDQIIYQQELLVGGHTGESNQSILIVGQGKSGTSKLTYVVSGGMAEDVNVHFEPKGRQGLADIGLHRKLTSELPVVTKSLYTPKSKVRFGSLSQLYDRKIWILRDPRDRTISLLLYRWFKGHKPDPKKYQMALELVKRKEADPASVHIKDIWDIVFAPGMYEKRLREEYQQLDHIISNLDDSWYILPYEHMVDGKLDELNSYLGFETVLDREVPDKFNRVVRSKAYGNWRHWFTHVDITFYQEVLGPFISKYCPHVNDWDINNSPRIDPNTGSEYMKRLYKGTNK